MKQSIRLLLSGAGIVALMCGVACTPQNTDMTQTLSEPFSSSSSSAIESPSAMLDNKPVRNIVMTSSSSASMKHNYAALTDLAKAPDIEAVIAGKVVKIEDIYPERVAYRVLTVELKQAEKKVNSQTVTVYEDGGVIPYAWIIPELEEKFGEKLEPASPDDYVDMRFMNARHTEIGDEIVAFVRANPNKRESIPAEYQVIGSFQGLFIKDPVIGQYIRTGFDDFNKAEQTISDDKLDSLLIDNQIKTIGAR